MEDFGKTAPDQPNEEWPDWVLVAMFFFSALIGFVFAHTVPNREAQTIKELNAKVDKLLHINVEADRLRQERDDCQGRVDRLDTLLGVENRFMGVVVDGLKSMSDECVNEFGVTTRGKLEEILRFDFDQLDPGRASPESDRQPPTVNPSAKKPDPVETIDL